MEEKLKSLKEMMSCQDGTRRRLTRVMLRKGLSLSSLATEMGISILTLRKFLVKEENITTYETFFKIENYILEQEKNLAITE